MKGKLMLLAGVGIGYVLGTRAGREQYERLRSQAKEVWSDPKVQEQVSRATETVKETAKAGAAQATEVVKEKMHSDDGPSTGSGSPGSSSSTSTASETSSTQTRPRT